MAIKATVESRINAPNTFEIWFRVDGQLVGRGLIVFDDRAEAERYVVEMLQQPVGEVHG